LREDIDILNTNSELRPVIELLEEEKYIEAYEELDNYDDTKMSPREEEDIKVLKARAIL
jgi:hypothetical protein